METDGFIVCPAHGDLWKHPGAGFNTRIDVTKLEKLSAYDPPKISDRPICPVEHCILYTHVQLRDRDTGEILHDNML